MKKLLLFSLLTHSIISQAVPIVRAEKHNIPEGLQLPIDVLQQQFTLKNYKSTAVMRRLLCTAYTESGLLMDSTRYVYSKQRGSTLTNPESYFQDVFLTTIDPTQNILCDSSVRWYNIGSSMTPITSYYYTYNSGNKATRVESVFQNNRYLTDAIYSSTGNLTDVISLDTNQGTAMVPKQHLYINYDIQNRRIYDSTYNIATNSPATKRIYNYNNSGYLDSFISYTYNGTQWELYRTIVYTYDASGRLLTELITADYGNGYLPQYRFSYTYSGTATQPILYEQDAFDHGSGTWLHEERQTYYLNSSQQIDTYYIYRYVANQWDTLECDVYTYTSFGLLKSSHGYRYTGNGQFSTTPYDHTNFYYEEYYPENIQESSAASIELRVYPNPSANEVRVASTLSKGKLLVHNWLGQLIHDEVITGQETTIDTRPWATGNYLIVLHNNKGQQIASTRFLKQ